MEKHTMQRVTKVRVPATAIMIHFMSSLDSASACSLALTSSGLRIGFDSSMVAPSLYVRAV